MNAYDVRVTHGITLDECIEKISSSVPYTYLRLHETLNWIFMPVIIR